MARKHRKPTLKQTLALKYINQGMTKRSAMIKAGYSPTTAKWPERNLFRKSGTQRLIDTMKSEMVGAGLTPKYMVAKFKEWMEAQKTEHSPTGPDEKVPDYDIQLKSYDKWEKVMGLAEEGTKGIKRKLTVEEFIQGDTG